MLILLWSKEFQSFALVRYGLAVFIVMFGVVLVMVWLFECSGLYNTYFSVYSTCLKG
jgi:hypothetical protein